jgi:hypothetical protein
MLRDRVSRLLLHWPWHRPLTILMLVATYPQSDDKASR